MKPRSITAFVSTMLACWGIAGTAAESIPHEVLAAHGGEALMNLATLTAEWRQSHALIHEDREPGPPWDHNRAWTGTALDLAGGRIAERRLDAGGGYHSDVALQAGPDGGQVADLSAGVVRTRPELTADRAGADVRQRLPGLIIRRAVGEPERWRRLEDGRCHGQPTRRFAFDDPGGSTWTVHVDPGTHLTRCLAYTFETYDGLTVPVILGYHDWRPVGEIPLPHTIEVTGPDVAGRQRLLHVAADASVQGHFKPFDLPREDAPDAPGFQVTALGDGIWVIGEGVFRQLFVELDDFVVAYDGLGGDVNRRLMALAERTGGKPVRYAILSHPHADHYPGLPELTAAGARVVAVPAHWPAVRRLTGLGDEHWIRLTDDWILDGGDVRLMVADIGPTPHAEHLVVMWLPEAGLLAQSDLLVRRHGALRAASANVRALSEALERRGWQPRIIQDGHSPWLATGADLATALTKQRTMLPPLWQTLPDLATPPLPRLDRALAAMGGADAVARAGGLALTLDGTIDLGTLAQGMRPGAAEPAPVRERLALDPAGDRVAHEWDGAVNPDARDHYRVIFSGTGRQDFVHLGDAFAFSTTGDFAESRARHQRIVPHRLLADLRRSELEWVGWDEVAGNLPDGTRIRLRLDPADGPPGGFSYRIDMPLLGDAWVEWRYRQWRTVDGFGLLPGEMETYLGADRLRCVRITEAGLGPTATEPLFTWPAGVARPEPGPATPEPARREPPPLTAIAPGTFLAANTRGGFHPLIVELEDRLVVVDAPSGWWELYQVPAANVVADPGSGAAAEALLASLAREFPGKRVGELVLTHHHSDHAGGLRPFVAAGASIVTHAANASQVRATARAPHTLTADRAAGLTLSPEIVTVRDRHVISDGARSMVLLEAGENPHASGMLVVWLPDRNIVYQSDLFEPAPDFIFPSRARLTVMDWFVSWLARNDLQGARVYAIHGRGRVTEEQLQLIRDRQR